MRGHITLKRLIFGSILTLTACGDSCAGGDGSGDAQSNQEPPYEIICGDDIIEGDEQCDALNLNGKSCRDFGFTGGLLMCNARCEYNTDLCTEPPNVVCGDGITQGNEQCDGADIKPRACPEDSVASCNACKLVCEPGPPAAKLLVDTTRVAFGKSSVGNINQKLITLTNAGVARIELKRIALEGQTDGQLRITFPDPAAPTDTQRDQQIWPPSLKFQATQLIRVIYVPLTEELISDKLIIESNDPTTPRLTIPIAAQATPCMAISQPEVEPPSPSQESYRLHFGQTTIGALHERKLRITNCSPHAALALHEVSFSQERTRPFNRLSPGRPLPNNRDEPPAMLDVGERAEITLSYEPATTLNDFAMMTIRSDDPSNLVKKVLLSGTGTSKSCPVTRITSSINNQDEAALGLIHATPGQTIKLDASGSYALQGELSSYQWSLQRSSNALSTRLLDDDAQVATLEVEDEGDYIVALSVTDTQGHTSCEPTLLQVEVRVDETQAGK